MLRSLRLVARPQPRGAWLATQVRSKTTPPDPAAATLPTTSTDVVPALDVHTNTAVVIKSQTASAVKADAISPESLAKLTPAYVTSSVPDVMMTKRRARIFRPTKNAMQSGVSETRNWQIDFDSEEKWENPLMGWASRFVFVHAWA
jgi:hypothetical protein